MSYKNHSWQVIATDFNSPLLRNELWTKSFFKYPKFYGIARPVLGISSKRNQIEYLTDLSTWERAHEELKLKLLEDPAFIDKLIDETNKEGEAFAKWTEREIYFRDLTKLENRQLALLLERFADWQGTIYALGTSLPLLDFQGFSFVEGNLEKFLKSKVREAEYAKYYEAFTEPTSNSFAQDQEEALLELMAKHYKNAKWRRDAMAKNVFILQKKYPEFYADLEKHTEKFAWIYYSYMGPAFTEADFLDHIRDHLKKKKNPKTMLDEIRLRKRKILQEKKWHLSALKPDSFNLAIINLAGKVVWGKPRRKDFQSRAYFHAEKLMREIGRRIGFSLEQARSTPLMQLLGALGGKRPDMHKVYSIYERHVVLPNDNGGISLLIGKRAEQFYRNDVKKAPFEKADKSTKIIRGACACQGRAKGTVKIINLPEDMEKMEYGDVLVSTATTPSIVTAMKKAVAIVTDEGGLTCHAAIVSRELNIPCVVGTKIATKVLKDGNQIEVDATKGIVRKLK